MHNSKFNLKSVTCPENHSKNMELLKAYYVVVSKRYKCKDSLERAI